MKPFFVDNDVVDAVFEVCQTDLSRPGLMLEDVQREECLSFADQLVGLGDSNVDELFNAADANDDDIVMRSEVNEAFQSLALSRSIRDCKKNGNIYKCSQTDTCCDSKCERLCYCNDGCWGSEVDPAYGIA